MKFLFLAVAHPWPWYSYVQLFNVARVGCVEADGDRGGAEGQGSGEHGPLPSSHFWPSCQSHQFLSRHLKCACLCETRSEGQFDGLTLKTLLLQE